MNLVTYNKLKREVGKQGIYRIEDLGTWVFGKTTSLKELDKFRIAPSIITRCEAEIFNLSMPRFAIKVYLDKQKHSFVNVRRLSTFCGQIRPWADRSKIRKIGIQSCDWIPREK